MIKKYTIQDIHFYDSDEVQVHIFIPFDSERYDEETGEEVEFVGNISLCDESHACDDNDDITEWENLIAHGSIHPDCITCEECKRLKEKLYD